MSLEYIREYYCVPAYRGTKVLYRGWVGKITGSSGPHLKVFLEKGVKPESVILHPTDVEYPDINILDEE